MATDNPTATPGELIPEKKFEAKLAEEGGAIMNSGDQPRKALDLMDEIDKKLAPAAPRPSESESDAFRTLMHRFLMATQRLTLAVHALERQEDYGPACCVVEEATEALEQLYREFEDWNLHREHTPKEVQNQDVPKAPPSSR